MRISRISLTLFLVVMVSFTFFSCKSTQPTIEPTTAEPAGPRIIFVTYKFNGDELELINKTITPGKFKTKSEKLPEKVKGDLVLIQLNAEKGVLDGMTISNPRVRVVEYVDDDGTFQKKTVNVENAEFTSRINLHVDAKYIMIKEVDEDATELLVMNLTEID